MLNSRHLYLKTQSPSIQHCFYDKKCHEDIGWDMSKAQNRRQGAKVLGPPGAQILTEHKLDWAIAYWREKSGARFAPRWTDIDLSEFLPVLLQGVMVADIVPEQSDFRIRYWGTGLVSAFGIEPTGERLSQFDHNGVMDSFIATAPDIIKTRAPQYLMHEINSPSGAPYVYPDVRLPLSEDGETVTSIMTVENIPLCYGLGVM